MKNLKFGMRNFEDSREYIVPAIEVIKLDCTDIITTSPGTETTPKEDNDGIWDLDLS